MSSTVNLKYERDEKRKNKSSVQNSVQGVHVLLELQEISQLLFRFCNIFVRGTLMVSNITVPSLFHRYREFLRRSAF